jgi:hypothetical protein
MEAGEKYLCLNETLAEQIRMTPGCTVPSIGITVAAGQNSTGGDKRQRRGRSASLWRWGWNSADGDERQWCGWLRGRGHARAERCARMEGIQSGGHCGPNWCSTGLDWRRGLGPVPLQRLFQFPNRFPNGFQSFKLENTETRSSFSQSSPNLACC